jgi:hypothetical protein
MWNENLDAVVVASLFIEIGGWRGVSWARGSEETRR